MVGIIISHLIIIDLRKGVIRVDNFNGSVVLRATFGNDEHEIQVTLARKGREKGAKRALKPKRVGRSNCDRRGAGGLTFTTQREEGERLLHGKNDGPR